jgi:hypothetical protein|tara:strand:- start:1635 stop:2825 length:1191 start_codon:yes stop_codon:yes gene_type:complete
MNNAETIHLPLPTDYYEIMRERITKLGYNDPKKDSDIRQREVWQYIEDNQIRVDIVKNFDFVTNLADREDPLYEIFQTRENCEDSERVDWLHSQFYGQNPQKQLRIIMGWVLQDFFPSLGNKRSRAHLKGQKINQLSESKAAVLVLGADLTDEEKHWHGFQIAEISNHDAGDGTEPETTADIVSQLRTARMLEARRDSSLTKQSEEEIKAWAKDWVLKKKPIYQNDGYPAVVGDIVARAFNSDRKDAIPMPEDDKIGETWAEYYPDEAFDPSNTEAEVIMRKSQATEKQTLERLLLNRVLLRKEKTDLRETYWIAARVGSNKRSVTSLSSVTDKRQEIIDFLTEWNTNDYYAGCAFPKVERIMFVKQLKGESDVSEMYVWSPVNREFAKKEKIVNG